MGAECSKLRQPMRAILALSRAHLLLIVVTRSRDLSRECHVTKHKTPARSNFPMSNFENFGTIQFSLSRSTSRGLCPKNFEKRAHPNDAFARAHTRSKYVKDTRDDRVSCIQGCNFTFLFRIITLLCNIVLSNIFYLFTLIRYAFLCHQHGSIEDYVHISTYTLHAVQIIY